MRLRNPSSPKQAPPHSAPRATGLCTLFFSCVISARLLFPKGQNPYLKLSWQKCSH